MGKGGTKFEENAIGHRGGGGSRGLTRKEARKNMDIFLKTGHHPELDKKFEQERGTFDDAGKLPQRNAHRPHVFMSVQTGEGNVGMTDRFLRAGCFPFAVSCIVISA